MENRRYSTSAKVLSPATHLGTEQITWKFSEIKFHSDNKLT
jgi:hypothetical protein